jgi:ATP-dependent Clp protease adaptor protein ClpS
MHLAVQAVMTAPTLAPATRPFHLPDLEEQETSRGGEEGWVVVVFNNEHNTYLEVISILMQATGCTLEEAEIETWEVDHLGQSTVHHGGQEECERVAAVIRTIGIQVEVKEE